MDAAHVPYIYLRVSDLVFRGPKLGGTSCFVRVIGNPVPVKVDSAKREMSKAGIVCFDQEFFFGLSDLKTLEFRVLFSEDEGAPAMHSNYVLDVSKLADNVCEDSWVAMQRGGTVGGTASLVQLHLRSPRSAAPKGKEAPGIDLQCYLHLRAFAARASDAAAAEKKLAGSAYASLVNLLVTPPFEEAVHLCSVAPQTAGDKVALSLVTVLEGARAALPFIRAIVQLEVSSTASSSVLFRSNSMAIRVLSAYGRLVGDVYLRAVLGDLVRKVCADATSYEPDPSIVPAEAAAANTAHIAALAESFLAQIMASEDQFPASFRVICSDVRRIVSERFADFWPRAVGGFFFLRFVCPGVASPTTSGLLEPGAAVTKNARRVLILVTKVLQNIANQTNFNEPWMHQLDAMAHQQVPLVEAFLERVSSSAPAAADVAPMTPEPSVVVRSLEDLGETFRDAELPSEALSEMFQRLGPSGKPFQEPSEPVDTPLVVTTATLRPFWDATTLGAQQYVMNAAAWLAPYREADFVASTLAATATQLVRRQLEREAEKGPFKEGSFVDWTELSAQSEFVDFEMAMSELHHVRLEALGAEARIAFWLNVLNCMTFVLHVTSHGKPSKVSGEPLFAVCGHLFSCDDVAYGVLRGGNTRLATSATKKSLLFRPDDPRRSFVTSFDSKITFCIVTFAWDSPVLRPYDKDPATVRRAASAYCENFVKTDLGKVEVIIPRLLEDNRTDWPEEDTTQRVLQLVQFVNARKLEILNTLGNPKCSVTVSKNKGPAHPIYWLGQMRLDEKARAEERGASKLVLRVSAPGASPASPALPVKDAADASPRSLLARGASGKLSPRGSNREESSSLTESSGWQRAQRSTAETSKDKIPPLQLSKRSAATREPRARSHADIAAEAPASPALDHPSTPPGVLGGARRSPRSPRVSAQAVFEGGRSTPASVASRVSTGFDSSFPLPGQPQQQQPPSPHHHSAPPDSLRAVGASIPPSESPSAETADASEEPHSPPVPPKPTSSVRLRRPSDSTSSSSAARKSPMTMSGTVVQLPESSSPRPPDSASPRLSPRASPRPATKAGATPHKPALDAAKWVERIHASLKALLVEACELVNFDQALATGKALMTARRALLDRLGLTEMPSTNGPAPELPAIDLTPVQRRFLPEAKLGTFSKLLQAFHSGARDIEQLLKELVTSSADGEGLLRVLEAVHQGLAAHVTSLVTAREEDAAGRADRLQVVETERQLTPELHEVVHMLAEAAQSLVAGTCSDLETLKTIMLGARSLLSQNPDKESSPSVASGDRDMTCEQIISSLIQTFGNIEALTRSPKATAKGMMLAALKTHQIKIYLDEHLRK